MSSTRKHKADDGDEGEEGSPSSSPRSSPHRVKKSPTSSSGNKKRRLGTNGSDDSTAATSSSSSSTSTSSSSVFSHPALHQLPPHLLNHSHGHPGGDLGESLRFSQVARLLDASTEDGGLGLGHSSSGLGTSTDSSFWKMLETEDPSEVTKQMNQTAELQQQLLKTAHLLRSSQDGTEAAGGNHNHQDASLYASQGGGGHQPQPSLSQSQLMSALMGSASANELLGEGVVDYPPLSASTHALLTSFIKQEGASSSGATIASVAGSGVAALPLPPPPHGTLAPSPASAFSSPTAAASSSGKKSGGGHKATRSGSTSPAPQSSSSTSSGGGQAAAQHSAAAAAAVAGMNDGSAAAALLSQLASMEESVDNQLKAMKFQQCDVIDTQLHNRAEMDKLLKAQGDLRKQIEQSVQRLEQLNDTHILTATDAYRLVCLSDSFALHARRLRLYQEELFQAQSGQPVKPVASLVITKQPFPCTVKQSKSVDDPVDVVLITGAKSEIQAMGQVKAELINEDYNPISKKKNSAPAIQNAAETMDESLMVTFKRLIFPHGSRVKSVNMRFAQEVTMNGSSMRLLSEPTKPFIVMTNHGQRSTTEGKLLKKHTFANRSEIPWPAFANAMQIHYIRATKQDPKKPVRPLSNKDIEYLHLTKFNGKMSINQEDYDQFWAWFGTILYKIRNHQKHILPMWIKGLIYGFLSREDSDRLLLTQGALPGSFLIRFSDRCAGQFVVVYVTSSPNKKGDGGDDREVKHYLINPEDIEKKSTLPDFLRDCENLWFLLQVVRDHDTGVVSLRPKNKDELLASFYSREKSQTLLLGYDNRQP